MRIAHFVQGRCNPDSANGVDKTVFYLSAAQASLGHTVSIFSISDKPVIPVPGVETRTYPSTRHRFAIPRSLTRELRAWQPSVVHLHSAYVPPNITIARWLRRAGIPYVVTPNGVLSSKLIRRRPYLKLPYKYALERPFLNRAAFVHAVGDAAEIRKFGVTAPLVFAPNGFSPASIPADISACLDQAAFQQLNDRKVVLFLGRLDVPQKGLDLVLPAFAEAARNVADLMLVLVGPDWKGGRKRLEALAIELGLSDRVVFWGPAFGAEKFELLARADIFVHASRWEGLTFAVIEALAMGIPCLVTPAADPLGLISRSGAGRTTDASVETLAQALTALVSIDSSELAQMGQAGRRLIDDELNWERIAETLASAYAQYCVAT
jgi:glycosyltransferase involved in cell wall biosynthesis